MISGQNYFLCNRYEATHYSLASFLLKLSECGKYVLNQQYFSTQAYVHQKSSQNMHDICHTKINSNQIDSIYRNEVWFGKYASRQIYRRSTRIELMYLPFILYWGMNTWNHWQSIHLQPITLSRWMHTHARMIWSATLYQTQFTYEES